MHYAFNYSEGFALHDWLTVVCRHKSAGLLSMANGGSNTNGCQFFVTLAPAAFLDGKHVVFGRLLDAESLLVARRIEAVPTGRLDRPTLPIVISQCGEL